MPEKDLWPISPSWDLRLRKHFSPFSRKAIESRYGKPVSLEDYCSKSQILQLEATKAMFEAFAGNKYKSSGVIYWMYNAAWPKFYWQLYDYFLMPNGAFYGTKKACEPLHIQYNYKENAIQLVNSFYQDFKGLKASAKVFDFNAKEIFTKEIAIDIKADESKLLFKPEIPKELSGIYFLKLNLTDKTGKEISSNFYWLSSKGDDNADFKDLAKLPAVEVTAKPGLISKENGKLRLVLEFSNPSSSIAFGLKPKLLSISTKEPILPIFWQDNYFALLPGEKRTIEMQVDASLVIEKAVIFRLDGWNLRAVKEEELKVP